MKLLNACEVFLRKNKYRRDKRLGNKQLPHLIIPIAVTVSFVKMTLKMTLKEQVDVSTAL